MRFAIISFLYLILYCQREMFLISSFLFFFALFPPPPNLFFLPNISIPYCYPAYLLFDLLTFLLFYFLISLARPLSRVDKGEGL